MWRRGVVARRGTRKFGFLGVHSGVGVEQRLGAKISEGLKRRGRSVMLEFGTRVPHGTCEVPTVARAV